MADALADVHGVVNAVSLYTERGTETFHAVHVECAERVAAEAQRIGIEQLVHVSGIGADPASGSPYVRSRGQGELAVRAAYPGAILIRPAVMFGPDDAFDGHPQAAPAPACLSDVRRRHDTIAAGPCRGRRRGNCPHSAGDRTGPEDARMRWTAGLQ